MVRHRLGDVQLGSVSVLHFSDPGFDRYETQSHIVRARVSIWPFGFSEEDTDVGAKAECEVVPSVLLFDDLEVLRRGFAKCARERAHCFAARVNIEARQIFLGSIGDLYNGCAEIRTIARWRRLRNRSKLWCVGGNFGLWFDDGIDVHQLFPSDLLLASPDVQLSARGVDGLFAFESIDERGREGQCCSCDDERDRHSFSPMQDDAGNPHRCARPGKVYRPRVLSDCVVRRPKGIDHGGDNTE